MSEFSTVKFLRVGLGKRQKNMTYSSWIDSSVQTLQVKAVGHGTITLVEISQSLSLQHASKVAPLLANTKHSRSKITSEGYFPPTQDTYLHSANYFLGWTWGGVTTGRCSFCGTSPLAHPHGSLLSRYRAHLSLSRVVCGQVRFPEGSASSLITACSSCKQLFLKENLLPSQAHGTALKRTLDCCWALRNLF